MSLGYQCASASTSRWPRSSTSRCMAFRHRTWPTTAVLSLTLVIGGCVPQRAEHDIRRDADIQRLQRQSICSCWTLTMEQSSIAPERGRLIAE